MSTYKESEEIWRELWNDAQLRIIRNESFMKHLQAYNWGLP